MGATYFRLRRLLRAARPQFTSTVAMKSSTYTSFTCTAASCCLVLSLAGCGEKHAAATGAKVPLVRVQNPVVQQVTDYEYFTGRTESPESVELRARVTGYLVPWQFDATGPRKNFNFVPGQVVKRSQVLFKIDPRPYRDTLDQAMGQVALAKAQLKLAIADYARAVAVSKTPGAISQQDVDKYAAAQSAAEAQVQAMEANAESAQLNFQFTDVISPIDGVVSRNLLSIGNIVNADTTLLTSIVSEDPMWAYFDVDERTMLRVQELIRSGKVKSVREGYEVPVDLGLSTDDGAYPHKSVLDFVNNQVDPSTGTLQVRGVLKNPKPPVGPRLFTQGMFVHVRLPIGPAHEALLVPQAAVGTDQGDRFVLVVNKDNVIEYRPVGVGQLQAGAMQEIVPQTVVIDDKGDLRQAKPGEQGVPSLTASDRVVVGSLQRVRPGSKVEVRKD